MVQEESRRTFMQDDFDYPMPKRGEVNWTLKDNGTQRRTLSQPRVLNRTDDIDGAKPGTTSHFKAARFDHKPDLYSVSDIVGASPARLVPETVHKPNNRITNNRDIEHSYPESKLFTTPRVVNPLEPHYPLPVVRHRIPTPSPQKHNPMQIHDIEGTRAKPSHVRVSTRDTLDYSDVPLSRAGALSESRKRKSKSMNLETRDINYGVSEHAIKPRGTNPLEPVYTVALPTVAGVTKTHLGAVEGSKPKGLPPARADRPLLSLRSDDIDGAKPGNYMPYPKQRREWKKTCDVSDIDVKGKRRIL